MQKKKGESDEDETAAENFTEMLSALDESYASEQTRRGGKSNTSRIQTDSIRKDGSNLSGFQHLKQTSVQANTSIFTMQESSTSTTSATSSSTMPTYQPVTKKRLTNLSIRNTQRLVNENNSTPNNANANANGTVESIQAWAEYEFGGNNDAESIDPDQKRAFEVICAHFVLTYYREAEHNETLLPNPTSE